MERKAKYYKIKMINSKDDSLLYMSTAILSYKDALQKYNEIKADNKNNDVHIEFLSVLQNGGIQKLFDKTYSSIVSVCNTSNDPIISKVEDKKDGVDEIEEKEETIYDIISRINEFVDKIEQRKTYIINLLSSYDKKRDVLLHNIENGISLTDNEKIQIFDEIQVLSQKRRDIKSENYIISSLLNLNVAENLKTATNSLNKIIKKQEQKKIDIQQNNKVPDTLMIHEIPYKNHKERIGIFSQMQKKFDKVTYDEERKVVIGYNKAYGT